MSVKFKAKQPWSGTFFKDRMNWLVCHEKLFVLATIPWPHSFFPLLHFFLLVTSHLSKNWSRVYVQGVPNYFSLSGRPGTACDFAFAVLMDLPIQGRVRCLFSNPNPTGHSSDLYLLNFFHELRLLSRNKGLSKVRVLWIMMHEPCDIGYVSELFIHLCNESI